jgi:hypothetical protein
MSTGSQVRCPAVVWSPDEPAEDQAALALLSRLQQLVHELWYRLPAEVQAIIACELRRVIVVPAWPSSGVTYGQGDEDIFLYLAEEPAAMQEAFEDWRPALSWVLVCGFGQAFLWALLTRLVGVNPERQAISPQVAGMPGAKWLMTMAAGRFGERSVQALLDRMIEALALAWGFGAELATVLELGCCRRLEGPESWGLEHDLRKVARALEAGAA